MKSNSFAQLVVVLALACGPKTPPEAPVDTTPSAEEQAAAAVEAAVEAETVASSTSKASVEDRVDAAVELLDAGTEESVAAALSQLLALSEEEPQNAIVRYDIGLAHERLGDLAAARKAYLRVTDLAPEITRAWLNLGAMAEREGDHTRALQNYRAGLRHVDDDPELFAAVIGVLRKLDRHDEAIEEARSAIKTNGNNVDAYNNLGLVYLEQGKLELAQFIYQRALSAIPAADANGLIHANLARVYLAQDKVPLAEKKFQDALMRDPDLVVAMMFLGQLYAGNRNWEGTVTVLKRARELEPDNAAIRVNLAIGLRGLGQHPEAEASYRKALELDPTLADVHLNLALLYGDSLQKFEEAFAELDQYIDKGGTRTDLVEVWRADFDKTKSKLERDAARKKRREEQRRKRDEEKRLLAEEEARKAATEAAGSTQEASPSQEDAAPPADAGATSSVMPGQSCEGVGSCGSSSALECAHDNTCREVGTAGTFGVGIGCATDSDCASTLSCVQSVCSTEAAGDAASPSQQNVPDSGTESPWGGQ